MSDCNHTCAIPCHRSVCPQCTRQQMMVRISAVFAVLFVAHTRTSQSCWCGRHRAMVRCGRAGYGCGEICGRSLPCGHQCESPCHEGPGCPPCPVRTHGHTMIRASSLSFAYVQHMIIDGLFIVYSLSRRVRVNGKEMRISIVRVALTLPCSGKTPPAVLECKVGDVDCKSVCGLLLNCGFHRCAVAALSGGNVLSLMLCRQLCGHVSCRAMPAVPADGSPQLSLRQDAVRT